MDSMELVVHDPSLLSCIISFLDDHFDLVNLSLASKFHRQTVLDSVERITVRHDDKLMEIPQVFPSLTKLDVSVKSKKSAFPILLSRLSNLENLRIRLPRHLTFGTFVSSLNTLSQLKVLNLHNWFLNDEIAEQIGKGCKLLQDITLTSPSGPLTNTGLKDLLLSSSSGLRRLSLGGNCHFEDDAMLVIIKCSTLTSLVITTRNVISSSIQDLSFQNLKLNCIRELRVSGLYLRFVDFGSFVDAIIRAGSPLEILELKSVSKNTLWTFSNCTTLQSLHVLRDMDEDEDLFGQFVSRNHGLVSLQLHSDRPLVHKAMVERILSVEGTKDGRDHNIDNENAVLDFFSRNTIRDFSYLFGFYQKVSTRVQFLREIKLNVGFSVEETYEGLYKLLSICTLLRKFKLDRNFDKVQESPMLCRALEALSGCANLENLRAPVGDESLRQILSGVKGLRKLKVFGPIEDFTDEALLLLKENSPFLRCLRLTYEPSNEVRITDRGLEFLSFCSQLQTLQIERSNIEGSGLIHLKKRCFWLNDLCIWTQDKNNGKEIERNIKELEFQKKGCVAFLLFVNERGNANVLIDKWE